MAQKHSRIFDDRINLRLPVLAACFAFGAFMGFYLNGLRTLPAPPPADNGTQDAAPPPAETNPSPPATTAASANAAPPAVADDDNDTPIAEVPAMAPPPADEISATPRAIDLQSMPPEPAVVFSVRTGLTGRTATPPYAGAAANGATTPPPASRVDFSQLAPLF